MEDLVRELEVILAKVEELSVERKEFFEQWMQDHFGLEKDVPFRTCFLERDLSEAKKELKTISDEYRWCNGTPYDDYLHFNKVSALDKKKREAIGNTVVASLFVLIMTVTVLVTSLAPSSNDITQTPLFVIINGIEY